MGDVAVLDGSTAPAIRVVLADDHELVRRGLRMVLDAEDDIEVVAEAARLRRRRWSARLEHQPDVLLLDLRMPGDGGVERVPPRRRAEPRRRASSCCRRFDDDADVYAVMEAGASGYLLKNVAPDALARSIRGVADGSVVMNPDVARSLLQLSARSRPTRLAGRAVAARARGAASSWRAA